MSTLELTINGRSVKDTVEPRLNLADFIRDQLFLTGTHIGCEQGVCGACTLVVDGQPARSCITSAIACAGADVHTIEGLEHDPVMIRLRAAFKAEHALQCGYCTPGMIVTARDIVRRLPGADEARIRLELSGNLCRCTGYSGIVKAIQRVMAETPVEVPVPVVAPRVVTVAAAPRPVTQATLKTDASAPQIIQKIRIALPIEQVWTAIKDPALIASCVPGAAITRSDGGTIEGEIAVALGPIKARFAGAATVAYEDDRSGTIIGDGRDGLSGTRLAIAGQFKAIADGAEASLVELAVEYRLRGALAQFSRAAVVNAFAEALGAQVARNIEATLRGGTVVTVAPKLGLGTVLLAMARKWLARMMTGR